MWSVLVNIGPALLSFTLSKRLMAVEICVVRALDLSSVLQQMAGRGGFDPATDLLPIRFQGVEEDMQGQLILEDSYLDIAFILVSSMPIMLPALRFGPGGDLPVGTPVFLLGNCFLEQLPGCNILTTIMPTIPTVSPGQISAPCLVDYGPSMIRREVQFTCSNKAGYSGSPLMHEEMVIGILGQGAYQNSLAVCTENSITFLEMSLGGDYGVTIPVEDLIQMLYQYRP
uniref:IPT/TIG domain-containing protein n=1 Tax=Leersia perrieri TaxID=77586 RepID=A0A0D9VAB9_9ORYZ